MVREIKKILILFLFFYILVLFETIISPFFPLLFLFVILINLFEAPQGKMGVFSALIGGFFLEVFSQKFFGFYCLILICISFFIKMIIKRVIELPSFLK